MWHIKTDIGIILHQLDRVQVVQTPQHCRIVSPIVHCPLGNAQASNKHTTSVARMFYFNISAKSMPFLVLMSSFYDRFACLNGHFGAISRLMLSVHCKFREGRAVWAPSLKSVTLLTGGPNWIFWYLDWSKNVTSMTGGGNWPYRCLDWCKNVTSLNHPLWSSACSSAFTPFWGWTESDKPRHHCTDKIIFTRITATATPSSYISLTFIIKRMGVDLSKWGWTKWIGMPVDIPFSAV